MIVRIELSSFKGHRTPRWLKMVFALALVGVLGFSALFGAVLSGSYDQVDGEPQVMVILGCQVKPWGPSILLQDRL